MAVPASEHPTLLAQTAARDPIAAVRIRARTALFLHHPDSAAARDTAHAALRQELAPTTTLLAASCLGHEGLDRVEPLLRDPRARAEVRALALARYAAIVPGLGAQLAAELLETPEAPVAAAAATALGTHRGRAAEPLLLGALHRGGEVAVAAAHALGAVGTAAALGPLRTYASALLTGAELTRAASEAVLAIEARTGPAERGALSLGCAHTGSLSPTDAEAGRVSPVRPAERARR